MRYKPAGPALACCSVTIDSADWIPRLTVRERWGANRLLILGEPVELCRHAGTN
jgi:hypothetical protein